RLHPAVDPLVVCAEVLVVRSIPGLGRIEQYDHEAGTMDASPDPARGLDVLGCGLRLARNCHQPEPLYVEAHLNHVRGETHVHSRSGISVIAIEQLRESGTDLSAGHA